MAKDLELEVNSTLLNFSISVDMHKREASNLILISNSIIYTLFIATFHEFHSLDTHKFQLSEIVDFFMNAANSENSLRAQERMIDNKSEFLHSPWGSSTHDL